MADTKANSLSKANPNDFPARVSDLRDAAGVGFGDTMQSLAPAASLGGKGATGWQEGVVVAADTVTLPIAGLVVHVEATAAAAAGPQALVTGVPATGQCQVNYDANGIPTLTFLAADAVTAIAVQQIQAGSGASAKLSANS